jgi:hypothetical protein
VLVDPKNDDSCCQLVLDAIALMFSVLSPSARWDIDIWLLIQVSALGLVIKVLGLPPNYKKLDKF